MAFRNGAYATVWSVDRKDNYTDVRISTSRKRKDNGEYVQDFGDFARMIGEAHTLAAGLKERDRIRIKECSCTNQYVKSRNMNYYNFQIYSFEMLEDNRPASFDVSNGIPDGVDDAELPFE